MTTLTVRDAVGLWLTVLVAVVGIVWFSASQRAQGRLQEQLARNAVHIATLDSSLKVERATFRADTVRVFTRITRVDSVFREILLTDTLLLTDTVKVTVEVVREAVATLNACRDTVRSCGELRAREQARGDSLAVRVRLLERARPSRVGNVLRSVRDGALGYGLASITRR